MSFPRSIRLALLMIAFLSAAAIPTPVAGDEAYAERHVQAAKTFWATIAMRIEQGMPGKNLLEDALRCESEHEYCYESTANELAGGKRQVMRWKAWIDHDPKWEGVETVPITEKWKTVQESDDPETGAKVFYRKYANKRRGGGQLESVYFKIVRDDVFAKMHVQRPAGGSKDAAIAKALARWRFFVRAAIHYGVFSGRPIELVPAFGDHAGQTLSSGSTVQHFTRYADPSSLPMKVRARPAGLEPGKPYKVRIELRPEARRFMRVTGDGVAAVRGGYELTTTREEAEVVFHFEKKAIDHKHANVGRVRFVQGERESEIAVDLEDWQPVVTRFEVTSDSGGRPPIEGDDGKQRYGDGTEVFASEVRNIGDLIDTWRRFEPTVTTRMRGQFFGGDEPVVNGWRRGILDEDQDPPEDPNGFYVAEQTGPKHLHHGTFKSGARLRINLDLLLVERPKLEDPAPGEPQFGDSEFDEEGFLDDLADLVNTNIDYPTRAEKRKRYRFDEYRLSIHLVDPKAQNWRGDAAVEPTWKLDGRSAPVDELIPLPAAKAGDDWVPVPSELFWIPRSPGIYEIRLTATIKRDGDSPRLEDLTRKLSVAVRIRVVPVAFSELMIEGGMRRKN